jgi:hypothetical protein
MELLIYQSLDLITEQYSRIKTKQEKELLQENKYNEKCYLGLLQESQIDDYEFDIYAYVSNTRYKYILLKNETHSIIKQIGSHGGILSSQAASAALSSTNQTSVGSQSALVN